MIKLNLQFFGGRGSSGGNNPKSGSSKVTSTKEYKVDSSTATSKSLSGMNLRQQEGVLNDLPVGTMVYVGETAESSMRYTKMPSGKWALKSWEDTPKTHKSSKQLLDSTLSDIRQGNEWRKQRFGEELYRKREEQVKFYRITRPKK